MTSTAYATADNPTNKVENDIQIKSTTPQGSTTANTLKGHHFKAYRIAEYKDVKFATADKDDGELKQGDVYASGYDMIQQNGSKLKDATLAAIKAAVTTTDGQGKVTIKADWTNRVAVDVNGAISFTGDAASLTPIQFVGKYFYGEGSDVYGNTYANKAEMRAFADSLLQQNTAAKDADKFLANPVQADGTDDGVDLQMNDDEAGLYLIVETSGENSDNGYAGDQTADNANSAQTVSRVMVTGTAFVDKTDTQNVKYVNRLVTTHVDDKGTPDTKDDVATQVVYTLGELNLKSDVVTVTKETTKVGDKDEVKDAPIGLGSKRGFTITTNIPNYMNDYQDWKQSGKNPVFTVKDNPSDNLTPDMGTVVVNVSTSDANGGQTLTPLTKDTDYTIAADDATQDPNDFKIDFKMDTDEQIKKLSGLKLVIKYDSTVNELAQVTDNSVDVDFSNDPTEQTNKTTHDDERLFETDLQLQKIAMNDAGTKLDGAQFDVTSGGADVLFTKNEDNTYTLDTTGTQGASKSIQLDSTKGLTTLKGLAKDATGPVTYHFKETAAPAGYILGDTPVEFDVTVTPNFEDNGDFKSVTYKVTSGKHGNFIDLSTNDLAKAGHEFMANVTALGQNDTTVVTGETVNVENTTNIRDFAKTGGQIAMYAIITGVLVIIGGFAFTIRNRRRFTNETTMTV